VRVPRGNDSPDNTINHHRENEEGDNLSDEMQAPVNGLIKKLFGRQSIPSEKKDEDNSAPFDSILSPYGASIFSNTDYQSMLVCINFPPRFKHGRLTMEQPMQ
jgi:hypothetical protein